MTMDRHHCRPLAPANHHCASKTIGFPATSSPSPCAPPLLVEHRRPSPAHTHNSSEHIWTKTVFQISCTRRSSFQRVIMSGGGTNSSLKKYLGSIKDTPIISLAKVNSDYKELDIAIVRATNHVERPANEKHVRDDLSTTTAPNSQNGTTGWELALVTAPSSTESVTAAT